MGLLESLAMLLLSLCTLLLPVLNTESHAASNNQARSLDALLQDYAYRAFHQPRTGVSYDGNVPSNLTGITISAMRLRSGSLRRKGVDFKKFVIPKGVAVRPYVERLVLVYQNLGNWSAVYYPLPGYTYLASVVGLLGYDASNLSATNLSELEVRASGQPISIRFSEVSSVPVGSTARCVTFDLQGAKTFSNVTSGNVCSTVEQGHFGIVVESTTGPSPAPSPDLMPPPPPAPSKGNGATSNDKMWWKIVGSVVGSILLLSLLLIMVLGIRRYKQRKTMDEMEKRAEYGEPLQMDHIGPVRAPRARGSRTPPDSEIQFVD